MVLDNDGVDIDVAASIVYDHPFHWRGDSDVAAV
jgi:hypothetical protein